MILNADNPQLRLCTVASANELSPLIDVKTIWLESNSAGARNFSAIAFQFGQALQKKLKIPVGLVVASVVGTTIE